MNLRRPSNKHLYIETGRQAEIAVTKETHASMATTKNDVGSKKIAIGA